MWGDAGFENAFPGFCYEWLDSKLRDNGERTDGGQGQHIDVGHTKLKERYI